MNTLGYIARKESRRRFLGGRHAADRDDTTAGNDVAGFFLPPVAPDTPPQGRRGDVMIPDRNTVASKGNHLAPQSQWSGQRPMTTPKHRADVTS